MPSGHRIECRGDSWVVRGEHGSYWCSLIENGWTDTLDDEAMPALAFPIEVEARSAFVQAARMYAERAGRHKTAVELLGLSE
jgi:hypothetical protein